VAPAPTLTVMRAVRITRFGGPEVLDIVDIPEPEAGAGQNLYDVSAGGVDVADTHQSPSSELPRSGLRRPHASPCLWAGVLG
jgi:NADPH:quinone reductase